MGGSIESESAAAGKIQSERVWEPWNSHKMQEKIIGILSLQVWVLWRGWWSWCVMRAIRMPFGFVWSALRARWKPCTFTNNKWLLTRLGRFARNKRKHFKISGSFFWLHVKLICFMFFWRWSMEHSKNTCKSGSAAHPSRSPSTICSGMWKYFSLSCCRALAQRYRQMASHRQSHSIYFALAALPFRHSGIQRVDSTSVEIITRRTQLVSAEKSLNSILWATSKYRNT